MTKPRRPGAAAPAQGQFLDSAPKQWGLEAAAWIVAGVVGLGVLYLIGQLGLGFLALLGGFGMAALTIVYGIRDTRRAQLSDKLVEGVSPLLGGRLDRSLVKVDRWSSFWDGEPTRIRVRYVASTDDADPGWLSKLRTSISRRVGADFEIVAHDRRRCVIVLEPALESSLPAGQHELSKRATRVVNELLSSPATPSPKVELKWDGEKLLSLDVNHGVGTRLSRPIYRQQIERTLSTMLPGRWRANWDLENDSVRFELRPDLPNEIWHPVPLIPSLNAKDAYADFKIPFGIDEDGHEMVWEPKKQPHLIISGTSGSGKTNLAHGLVKEITARGARCDINDAKLIEFLGFRDWPNVGVVAANIEEQIRLIHNAWDLQEERYELIVNGEADEEDFEPYFLFCDEFADFREAVTDWYADVKVKGDPARPPVLKKFRSVARKGRTARVHLVVGIQRPDAEFFNADARDNFRARISMGRLSPQGALMMWENASTGVSLPSKKIGLGITLNADSRPVEFLAYRNLDPRRVREDDHEAATLLEQLRPRETRHERQMIILPKPMPHLDSDTGKILEPIYSEFASAKLVPFDAERAAAQRPKLTAYAGGGQPSMNASTSRARLELVDEPDDDDELAEDVDGYGSLESVQARSLKPGDMVLIDDTVDLWGVVENAEPDVVDEDYMCIDYRTDDGDEGSVSIPDDDDVTVRKPIEVKS